MRRMAETILVTAFKKFFGEPTNSSEEDTRELNGASVDGFQVRVEVFPVEYGRVNVELPQLIRDVRPVAHVAFGQAAEAYKLESIARNSPPGPYTDETGTVMSTPIRSDGRPTYASSLPLGAIKAVLEQDRANVVDSNDAGKFLCEYAFYLACYTFEKERLPGRVGFVHVPSSSPQDDMVARKRRAKAVVEAVAAVMKRTKSQAAVMHAATEFANRVKGLLEAADGRPYCGCDGLKALCASGDYSAAFDEALRLVEGGADSWCFMPYVGPHDRVARNAERAALIEGLKAEARNILYDAQARAIAASAPSSASGGRGSFHGSPGQTQPGGVVEPQEIYAQFRLKQLNAWGA